MAEQKVVTAFEIELTGFDAKIKAATDAMSSFDKASEQAAEGNKDFSANATTAAKSAENLSGKAGSASEKVRHLAVVTEDAGEAMQTAAKTAADYAKQAEEARKKSKSLADTIAEQKRITLEFQRELDGVNKRLKDLPAGSTGFIQLTKRANELKDAIADNKDALKGLGLDKTDADRAAREFTNLSKSLAKSAGDTDTFSSVFGEFKSELNSAFPIIGKIGNAAKLLGKAFTVALGPVGIAIAAVVAALGFLVKAFFGTQEGADKLAKVTAVASSIFNGLVGITQRLGKVIFDAFSDPKQAVSDLWEALKTNIVNRITGLADQFKFLGEIIAGVFTLDSDRITTGVKNFGEATTRVLTGVEDLAGKVADGYDKIATATDKAFKAGLRIAEIDKTLKNLRLERVSNEGRITRELAEQENIAGNVLKSSAERNAAAEKFKALNKELTSFEQRRLDLEIEKLQLSKEESQRTTEEKIAIQELIGEKEEALAREIKANEDISRTIQSLNKADARQAQAANDKAIAEAERVTAERIKAEQEALQAAIDRVKAQDAFDLELSNRKAALLKAELNAVKANEEQQLAIRLAGGEQLVDVLADQATVRNDLQKEIQDAEIGALLAKFDAEYEAAVQARADIAELTRVQEKELGAFKAKKGEEDLQRQQEQFDAIKRLQEQELAAEQNLQDAKSNAVKAGADLILQSLSKTEEGAKIALAIQKAQAVAQVVVATSAGIQAALASAGIAVGTLGPVAVAAYAAPTIAKLKIGAALNIATILAQAIGGAYEGGIVGENGVGTKIHSGRDGYASMVHKGEHIMPSAESRRYMPYLEMMRGGKFEEWVAGMQNATAQGGYKDIKVPGFNDRKLVGAMGSVGSLNEQRKQTELLASLNKRMGRRGNKRYVA